MLRFHLMLLISIKIIMTVDWEGDDLKEENLQAMNSIRQEFPDVPLVHYLNAAYFTKPQADKADIRKKIDRVLRPGDQLGLHLHGWKTLFEAAGVTHRLKPSWERKGLPSSTRNCSRDCGSEIPIVAYRLDELRKVLQTSKRILGEAGYKDLRHFRSGGWVTSPALMEALAAEGFRTDSSAVPVPFLADELAGMDLLVLLRAYWPDIKESSQPYPVKTAAGTLMEYPDNAALADYMKASESLQVITNAWKDLKSSHTIVAGFHQETADEWQDRVRDFLRGVQKLAKDKKAPLTFGTFPE